MKQSRRSSLVEACMNTIIGYFISLIVQLIVYPAFGAKFTFMDNIHIGFIFMVVSLIRSYVIRRWFEQYIHRAAIKITKEENETN